VTPSAAAVRFESVTKTFRQRRREEIVAVRDLSLTLRRGEIYGFLGPNGAGKSTAIHCLLGLLRPTSGTVRLFDAPLDACRDVLRRVGYMPEDWSVFDYLTAEEMLLTMSDLQGLARAEARRRIGAALERVGLAAHSRRAIRRLSKGMRQRASLAQAILAEPDLLVLDEPTKELDPVGRRDVRTLLAELAARGTAVFMSSHLLSEVESVSHRIGVIHQGRLVAEGDLASLLGRGEERIVSYRLPAGVEPVSGSETAGDGAWSARAATQADLHALLSVLAARGAEIDSVRGGAIRLEDYFIEVVGTP
jgi:ABC-2 type transport system ATP-binding protein